MFSHRKPFAYMYIRKPLFEFFHVAFVRLLRRQQKRRWQNIKHLYKIIMLYQILYFHVDFVAATGIFWCYRIIFHYRWSLRPIPHFLQRNRLFRIPNRPLYCDSGVYRKTWLYFSNSRFVLEYRVHRPTRIVSMVHIACLLALVRHILLKRLCLISSMKIRDVVRIFRPIQR